jgi:hypothetical protein
VQLGIEVEGREKGKKKEEEDHEDGSQPRKNTTNSNQAFNLI